MFIKNLGPVKELNLNLNEFTIFIGENNTGKTYISYLVYGIIKKAFKLKRDILGKFINEYAKDITEFRFSVNRKKMQEFVLEEMVERLNSTMKKELPIIFKLPEEHFLNTKIIVEKSDLKSVCASLNIKNYNFLFPSGLKNNEAKLTYTLNDITGTVNIIAEDENDIFEFKNFTRKDSEIELESFNYKMIKESPDINVLELIQQSVRFMIPSIYSHNNNNLVYIPAERNGINVFKDELIQKRANESFSKIEWESEEQDFINNLKNDDYKVYPLVIDDYMKFINNINHESDSIINDYNKINRKIGNNFSINFLKGFYYIDENSRKVYFESFSNNSSVPLNVTSSSVKSLYGLEYYLKNIYKKNDILFIDEPEMNLDPNNQVEIAKVLLKLNRVGIQLLISTHSDYFVRALTNELLKIKLEKNEWDFVNVYHFTSNGIRKLDNLTDNSFIENFDNTNNELQREYMNLLDELEDE